MKKRKILILLMMACMLLITPLSACGDNGDTSNLGLQGFSSFLSAKEEVFHSSVSQLEGEMVEYNIDKNIVVLKTSETSVGGSVTDTFKVYDLETLEEIHKSTSNYFYGEEHPSKIVSVNVGDYPIIEVVNVSYSSQYDSDTQTTIYNPQYEYEYFLPGMQENFAENDKGTVTVNKKKNLYECRLGDFVYWVSGDYEVLRTYPSFVVSGYASPKFDAEYNGYLYDFELSEIVRKIQVFNKEGICQVEYDYPQKVGMANPYVLNNGDVFVQEFEIVEDGEDYDVLYPMGYMSQKFNVNNKIINHQTGEVKDIDFDYLVTKLDSYYSQEKVGTNFPFELAKGKHNQAMLTKIVNKAPANTYKYAVLDNSMKIVYAVKNDTLDSSVTGYAELIGMEDGYLGATTCGKGIVAYYFDYEGNVKCIIPENFIGFTDKYIVTDTAILDYSLNVVFDYETCDIIKKAGNSFDVMARGNQVVVTVSNPYTGAERERYHFDGTKLVLVADDIDTVASYLSMSYMVKDNENETTYVYSYDGELLFVYQSVADTTKNLATYSFNKIDVITAEIGGNKVCYVIR